MSDQTYSVRKNFHIRASTDDALNKLVHEFGERSRSSALDTAVQAYILMHSMLASKDLPPGLESSVMSIILNARKLAGAHVGCPRTRRKPEGGGDLGIDEHLTGISEQMIREHEEAE